MDLRVRSLRRWCLVIGTTLVLSTGFPTTVDAQAPVPSTSLPSAPPSAAGTPLDPGTIGDDRVAPEILDVAVRSPEYDAAIATYQQLTAQLAQARATYDTAVAALVELDAQDSRLRRQLDAARVRHTEAETRITELRATIDDAAVTSYMSGGTGLDSSQAIDWEDATERGSRRAITQAIIENQVSELALESDRRDRAAREIDRTVLLLEAVVDRHAETVFVRDSSLAAAFILSSKLTEQATVVADARLTAPLQQADFQFNVLDAYVKAANTLQAQAPMCGIRWEVLAGISRTEGHHGTYRGSHVEADGQVEPPIVGIALNGDNNTAVVGDSDGGQWDGDTTQDRAVGPMQFIPGSWRAYGADGNGDGVVDPHNMYDATLAAGNLLCSRGSRLDTPAGLADALGHYNNSLEYIRVVSERIGGYDRLELY